jgi:hypothetical protein
MRTCASNAMAFIATFCASRACGFVVFLGTSRSNRTILSIVASDSVASDSVASDSVASGPVAGVPFNRDFPRRQHG